MSYQRLPAALVGQSTTLSFVYVSADAVVERSLAEIWVAKDDTQ